MTAIIPSPDLDELTAEYLPPIGSPDAAYFEAGGLLFGLLAETAEITEKLMWLIGDFLAQWEAEGRGRGTLTHFVRDQCAAIPQIGEGMVWRCYAAALAPRVEDKPLGWHRQIAKGAESYEQMEQRVEVALEHGMTTSQVADAAALERRGTRQYFGQVPELHVDRRGNVYYSANGSSPQLLYRKVGSDEAAEWLARKRLWLSRREPIDAEPPAEYCPHCGAILERI